MNKSFALFLAIVAAVLSGCGGGDLWAPTDYELSHPKAPDPVVDQYEDAPAWVENWFYREFSDAAEFPEVEGETEADRINAVAEWVAGFDYVPEAFQPYLTTGATVDANAGSSADLAWLTFHAGLANNVDDLSVELIEWNDGNEAFVCIWRNGGTIWVVDGGELEKIRTYLADGGRLVYGFDRVDYWTYSVE